MAPAATNQNAGKPMPQARLTVPHRDTATVMVEASIEATTKTFFWTCLRPESYPVNRHT